MYVRISMHFFQSNYISHTQAELSCQERAATHPTLVQQRFVWGRPLYTVHELDYAGCSTISPFEMSEQYKYTHVSYLLYGLPILPFISYPLCALAYVLFIKTIARQYFIILPTYHFTESTFVTRTPLNDTFPIQIFQDRYSSRFSFSDHAQTLYPLHNDHDHNITVMILTA